MKTIIKKKSVMKIFSDKKEFERYIKQKELIEKAVLTPKTINKGINEKEFFIEIEKIKNQKILKYINYKKMLNTALKDLIKIHELKHDEKELKYLYKKELERYKNKLNYKEYNKILNKIENIKGKTKIIHGDYSHANILYNKGKNYIIDYEFVKPFDNYYDLNTVYYWLIPTKKIFVKFCKKYFNYFNEKFDRERLLLSRIVFLFNYLERSNNFSYRYQLKKTIKELLQNHENSGNQKF